jgi:hypothetical protein
MSFAWSDFLDLAHFLQTGPVEIAAEVRLRAVVGRAYYAAFGVARSRAQSEGFIPLESAEDHFRLRDHFERTGRRDIARQLSRLRQWRNQCDYQDAAGNVVMMAKESTAEAHRVIRKLSG